MGISAFLPVYNEENRIKFALNSLIWCDEVIVLDKGSTDKTKQICLEFQNVRFFSVPNSVDMDVELSFFLEKVKSDWFIIFTASDIIHPTLANEIKNVLSYTEASIISIPFRRIVLGIDSKRSPWYTDYNPIVFKKSEVYIDKKEVHGALKSTGSIFKVTNCDDFPMFHLTHECVDILMKRHIRYWEGEAKEGSRNLDSSFRDFFKALFNVLFIKKTYLLGYSGIALIFAFLSYKMMSFVYKWDYNNNTKFRYNIIRENIQIEWDKTIK
ncbi:MAG: hypothetical protein RLY43_756 [Bacteroidota bacterium]